jgi:hypothetical protein
MADEKKPTPLTGDAEDIAQSSDLCKDCGMCCNG